MLIRCSTSPEKRGVSSRALLRFLKKLNDKKIPMHSLLIARGNDPILNAYWAPFDNHTLHRQNSVTKSFVSLAIGLLEQEGKLSLDDKVIRSHFAKLFLDLVGISRIGGVISVNSVSVGF